MFRGKNLNVFSAEGCIMQMQYACEASKLGATSFGICIDDAIILAVEKRPVSPLLVAGALDKIIKLDTNLYCAISGMSSDARSLIDKARMLCAQHRFNYKEYMPIESLVVAISQHVITFGMGADDSDNSSCSESETEESSSSDSNEESDDDNRMLLSASRPYGVALLFAGIDNGQLQLWHLEPTGEFGQHTCKGIGSAGEAAEKWLLRHYKPYITVPHAMEVMLNTVQVVNGCQRPTSNNVEMMVITKEPPQCHLLSGKELEHEATRCYGPKH
ncbi:proteasome subunit alpha type-5-like [Drosophila serrata]|uniref:proteasome subunit alpha type-5-like n=1 Tax=Drosophila serrata TaxID=7274 RepID=UPI000A1D3326|nr:proteasome subunit alpha type-5-like [Drosophila serrata]